ncbi:hypothetical protein GOBAR_DD35771 [Gossypium barbadense]|nr:hypothetical protein GOBAR_DD35771 [Gossypium barbadense]
MVQPTLQKISSKSLHEPCSNNNKGPIYEERRLQIEELDEWRTHKPRKHNKPKPRHDELNTSPNQLKVGDKVLLDAVNPRISTSEPNKEIPLTAFQNHTARHMTMPYAVLTLRGMTRPCDMAVYKQGKKFSLTRDTISCHDRVT